MLLLFYVLSASRYSNQLLVYTVGAPYMCAYSVRTVSFTGP